MAPMWQGVHIRDEIQDSGKEPQRTFYRWDGDDPPTVQLRCAHELVEYNTFCCLHFNHKCGEGDCTPDEFCGIGDAGNSDVIGICYCWWCACALPTRKLAKPEPGGYYGDPWGLYITRYCRLMCNERKDFEPCDAFYLPLCTPCVLAADVVCAVALFSTGMLCSAAVPFRVQPRVVVGKEFLEKHPRAVDPLWMERHHDWKSVPCHQDWVDVWYLRDRREERRDGASLSKIMRERRERTSLDTSARNGVIVPVI